LHDLPNESVTSGLPRFRVASNVSWEMFRTFLSPVKGESIEMTNANLFALCDEFGFNISVPFYLSSNID
jgi:hypothetical protein